METESGRRSTLSTVPSTAPWTIADVVDFEYLLESDGGRDPDELASRDAQVFREAIAPRLGSERRGDRRAIFHAWLEERRREAGEPMPGRQFSSGWRMMLTLGIAGGLVLGGATTFALLRYQTLEPINVAVFLGWTLGVQWLVLLLAAFFGMVRQSLPDFRDTYPVHALLWAFDAALRKMPGDQRERLRAALATIAQKREIYRSLTVWPLMVVTQLFAVAFNAGILGAMLAHVGVIDTRFGWQTTLGAQAAQVHRVVRIASAPWAGLVDNPHPTEEQIAQSRYAPGQSLHSLSASATRAWWPFLFCAIAGYGLLVRMALLLFAVAKMRLSLGALRFDHHGCNALFRRLTGPIVQTDSDTTPLEIPAAGEPLAAHRGPGAPCIGLIASDLDLSEAQLAAGLREKFGWQLLRSFPAEIDHPSGNAEAVGELAKAPAGLASVVVAIRAHRPPIKAIALFLQKIASAVNAQPELILLLVGGKQNGAFAPVSDEELAHWRNFSAIHRLRLGIEKWSAE